MQTCTLASEQALIDAHGALPPSHFNGDPAWLAEQLVYGQLGSPVFKGLDVLEGERPGLVSFGAWWIADQHEAAAVGAFEDELFNASDD